MIPKEEFMERLHKKAAELRAERDASWAEWMKKHPSVQSTQVLALAELIYELASEEPTP